MPTATARRKRKPAYRGTRRPEVVEFLTVAERNRREAQGKIRKRNARKLLREARAERAARTAATAGRRRKR